MADRSERFARLLVQALYRATAFYFADVRDKEKAPSGSTGQRLSIRDGEFAQRANSQFFSQIQPVKLNSDRGKNVGLRTN